MIWALLFIGLVLLGHWDWPPGVRTSYRQQQVVYYGILVAMVLCFVLAVAEAL